MYQSGTYFSPEVNLASSSRWLLVFNRVKFKLQGIRGITEDCVINFWKPTSTISSLKKISII